MATVLGGLAHTSCSLSAVDLRIVTHGDPRLVLHLGGWWRAIGGWFQRFTASACRWRLQTMVAQGAEEQEGGSDDRVGSKDQPLARHHRRVLRGRPRSCWHAHARAPLRARAGDPSAPATWARPNSSWVASQLELGRAQLAVGTRPSRSWDAPNWQLGRPNSQLGTAQLTVVSELGRGPTPCCTWLGPTSLKSNRHGLRLALPCLA